MGSVMMKILMFYHGSILLCPMFTSLKKILLQNVMKSPSIVNVNSKEIPRLFLLTKNAWTTLQNPSVSQKENQSDFSIIVDMKEKFFKLPNLLVVLNLVITL